LTIVAGIHPDAPGFASVSIAPHPGGLKSFDASMPHPRGMIRVQFAQNKQVAEFIIELPESLKGTLHWKGRSYPLHGGRQTVQAK